MIVLACCVAAAGVAQANFSDNFDSYLTGTLAPQNSWQGWDNNPAAAIAVVTNNLAYSSPNSVLVSGADDLVHQFTGATSGQWEFSLKQYIPSASTGTTYIILMNDYNDGGPYDWAVQTAFNMNDGVLTAVMGNYATNAIIKDQWIDFKLTIDLDANTVTEYYNGAVLASHAWTTTPTVVGVKALDLYAEGSDPVYYDNVSLAAIPEPGSMMLLGLFGSAVFLWQRLRGRRQG